MHAPTGVLPTARTQPLVQLRELVIAWCPGTPRSGYRQLQSAGVPGPDLASDPGSSLCSAALLR